MRYAWLLALAACGDNHAHPDAAESIDAQPIDVVTPDADPLRPATLFGTGLCVDKACTQISADVHPYTPQFVLWADTASKRRWIFLPPGGKIDTSDMDYWVFPMGTKLWKEFSRDGVRVETRFLSKIGPGNTFNDWYMIAYQWNATEDDTMAVPQGVQMANGTMHNIPSRQDCHTCHDNLDPTRVLGFGALQLDTQAAAGELDLDGVIALGWLTAPPSGTRPRFPLPTSTGKEPPALGYMHANCGHCHNPTSRVFKDNGVSMVLRESVHTLGTLAMTPPYMTAVDQPTTTGLPITVQNKCTTPVSGTPAPCLVAHGDPTNSGMIVRFETANPSFHMPALGTSMMDPAGDNTLRDWITNIP